VLTVITHLNAPKLADTSDAELAVLGVPLRNVSPGAK
jgi:hypothetical protein